MSVQGNPGCEDVERGVWVILVFSGCEDMDRDVLGVVQKEGGQGLCSAPAHPSSPINPGQAGLGAGVAQSLF